MDLRRFRLLREAGATYKEIAAEVGVDWRTVRRNLAVDGAGRRRCRRLGSGTLQHKPPVRGDGGGAGAGGLRERGASRPIAIYVSGHADLALAERREAQAVILAAQGFDYGTIARAVGYTSRGTAWATVMKALREHTAEGVEELRAIEGDRLDALQARIWDEAMAGDVAAVNAAVRIVEQRCRLFVLHWTAASSAARGVVITE